MTKITADHLGRGAFVYIRQSTVPSRANTLFAGTSELRTGAVVHLARRHDLYDGFDP
jgi:hypothetical protein